MKDNILNEVFISFDDLDILSAMNQQVVLRAYYFSEENSADCILYLPRKMFHKMLDSWLFRKEDYFKRYGHWCGTGSIHIEVQEIEDAKGFFTKYNEKTETEEKIDAKTFVGIKYSVDMEHG